MSCRVLCSRTLPENTRERHTKPELSSTSPTCSIAQSPSCSTPTLRGRASSIESGWMVTLSGESSETSPSPFVSSRIEMRCASASTCSGISMRVHSYGQASAAHQPTGAVGGAIVGAAGLGTADEHERDDRRAAWGCQYTRVGLWHYIGFSGHHTTKKQ